MPKPSQPPGASPTLDGFLRAVLRSRLLEREALQAALRPMPTEQRGDVEAVAHFLVRTGKLTRFQASKLLRGASLGLVLGPYQVLAPIARGGMGTVYLAKDVRSDLLVALKILPPKRAREEERLLARFRREMEMCQRVSHPHLAWTYEGGVHRGVYYIAMEYIPGRSLYKVVVDEGPLPVPRAARLFAEVALAIDHAHNQGLIHRDLKPSNIMVTPNDHAKVLDLGLALMEGEGRTGDREVIGGQGYVLGTMDYIAPEQTDDPTKVDVRCDIYALGCSLYYTLTGRPPFPGGTSKEKILKHRTEEPVDVSVLNPSVPAGFVELLRRTMKKLPDERMPSAALLRHELLRWAEKGPALPLDRPEDEGYRQAVKLIVDHEPSAEAVAEALPASDEAAPEAVPAERLPPDSDEIVEVVPLPEPRPAASATRMAADETSPVPVPLRAGAGTGAAPIARPVRPPSPNNRPAARTVTPETRARPLPPWFLYLVPVAAGAFVGIIMLILIWFFLLRR